MELELWTIDSGNRITTTDDAAEMREIIRVLLVGGWTADNLSLDLGDGELSAAELLAWLTDPRPARRPRGERMTDGPRRDHAAR